MTDKIRVGERMRIARITAKLKQDDVARRLGISKSNISEWETGKRSPSIDQIDDIAEALNTTPNYLLGFASNAYSSLDLSTETVQFAIKFEGLSDDHKRLAQGFVALLQQAEQKT